MRRNSPRHELVLEKPDLIVVVHGDEIIVRTLGFYATYYKTIDQPQLVLREQTNLTTTNCWPWPGKPQRQGARA